MNRCVAAMVMAGVLSQGCGLVAAGVVAWSSAPPRVTREAYAACLADRERRQADDLGYKRDCDDPKTYPQPGASPFDFVLIGTGLAIDLTLVLTIVTVSQLDFDLDLAPISIGGQNAPP